MKSFSQWMEDCQSGQCGDSNADSDEFTTCPACSAENHVSVTLLGKLGNKAHHKCRQCGMQYSHDEDNMEKPATSSNSDLESLYNLSRSRKTSTFLEEKSLMFKASDQQGARLNIKPL